MRIENNPAVSANIDIRPVDSSDVMDVLSWRNDPRSRAMSLQDKNMIEEETHRKWFAGVLTDPSRIILIGLLNGAKFGMVRFDNIGDDLWRISIIVAPDFRGRGLATSLLHAAIGHFVSQICPVQLYAEVVGGNRASISVFRSNGFTYAGDRKLENGESILIYILTVY